MTLSRKLNCLLTAAAIATAVMAGCNKPEPEKEPDSVELEDLKLSVPVKDNWVFSGRPTLTISVENPNPVAAKAEVKVRIATDTKKEVTTFTQAAEVPAKGSMDIDMTVPEELAPGFYKASCYVNNRSARMFNFGVSPEKIVSAPDKQADFDTFWDATLTQLENVEMNATLTELPDRSSSAVKVYLVEIQSIPDGLEGDPVLIHGYYLEPQDGQKHPVLIHYFGYDDLKPGGKLDCPSGGSKAEFAEFYLSTRGQIINNRTAAQRKDGVEKDFVNTYGDWFAFQFGDRDGYYYRGAFMDCVQAVRFMATRQTSDMDNVFAEGSSQGGAFSYAAAALSPYPLRAVAPCVAFLGDFPDYFSIVDWPANVARKNQGSMTDAEMYTFLSYFDTKNLATRITCSVIACSGLQDGTCPPHTNTAPYNNLTVEDKQMFYYPQLSHQIPGDWNSKYMKFFKDRIR